MKGGWVLMKGGPSGAAILESHFTIQFVVCPRLQSLASVNTIAIDNSSSGV